MARVHLAVIAPFIAYALLALGRPAGEGESSVAHRSRPSLDADRRRGDGLSRQGLRNRERFHFSRRSRASTRTTKLGGRSPKFACKVGPEDEVKVKFGGANGEVYAEVPPPGCCGRLDLAPIACIPSVSSAVDARRSLEASNKRRHVACSTRPSSSGKCRATTVPAVDGWSWQELETVDEKAGGRPRASRRLEAPGGVHSAHRQQAGAAASHAAWTMERRQPVVRPPVHAAPGCRASPSGRRTRSTRTQPGA